MSKSTSRAERRLRDSKHREQLREIRHTVKCLLKNGCFEEVDFVEEIPNQEEDSKIHSTMFEVKDDPLY